MKIEKNPFCQSCSRPLDKSEILGTEKDGSKNREYCRYCYKDGAFTEPSISLETMREHVNEQMHERKMDAATIAWIESILPYMKRWTATNSIPH